MSNAEQKFQAMKTAFETKLEELSVSEIGSYDARSRSEACCAVAETLIQAGAIIAMKDDGYMAAEYALRNTQGRLPTLAQALGKLPLSPPPAVESMPTHAQERLTRSVDALCRMQVSEGVKPQHMVYTLLTVGARLVYESTGRCSHPTALIINALAEIAEKEPIRSRYRTFQSCTGGRSEEKIQILGELHT